MDTSVREQVFEHLRWWSFIRRRHCPHVDVMGIYGPQVRRTRGHRQMWCRRCGRVLDGPVQLAEDRRQLVLKYHGADTA